MLLDGPPNRYVTVRAGRRLLPDSGSPTCRVDLDPHRPARRARPVGPGRRGAAPGYGLTTTRQLGDRTGSVTWPAPHYGPEAGSTRSANLTDPPPGCFPWVGGWNRPCSSIPGESADLAGCAGGCRSVLATLAVSRVGQRPPGLVPLLRTGGQPPARVARPGLVLFAFAAGFSETGAPVYPLLPRPPAGRSIAEGTRVGPPNLPTASGLLPFSRRRAAPRSGCKRVLGDYERPPARGPGPSPRNTLTRARVLHQDLSLDRIGAWTGPLFPFPIRQPATGSRRSARGRLRKYLGRTTPLMDRPAHGQAPDWFHGPPTRRGRWSTAPC